MGFGSKFWKACCSPGKQHTVECAAPSQFVCQSKFTEDSSYYEVVGAEIPNNITLYNPEDQKSWGSRVFDAITQYAGARITFVITLLILITWAIVGIVLGAPENWQIVMQDGGSIQCYISDTLLMRQQQNHCYKLLTIISQLRSRNTTQNRLLHNSDIHKSVDTEELHNMAINDNVGDAVKLPNEHWFDQCCNWFSMAVGSLGAWAIYWGGIFAWVGLGHSLGWSDLWQLYINTAVAVELTFTSMFLQNTRRRHMEYLEKCLKSIMEADCQLELLLRQATGDNEPNPTITIVPPKVTRSVRAIDYYGDVIGSGVGAVISLAVFATWLAIGQTMEWDSNWWLIIGTYTGLVGFVDGFVLRNVYFRQDVMLDEQFKILIDADEQIFQYLNVPLPTRPLDEDRSLKTRISNWMGYICAKPGAVLVSLIIVVALICVASGMQWDQTGQLLCNTPTMIIEGFLLIVLIQAHNMSNIKRRVQLHDILIRRLKLLQCVQVSRQNGHPNEKHDFNRDDINEKSTSIKN